MDGTRRWRGEETIRSGSSSNSSKGKGSTFKDGRWIHTSRTLYVTNVSPSTTTASLDSLFKDLDGFVALRRVRTMCFVDFESKQQATSAIWRTNGHKFNPEEEGILVSYDKDDNEERGGWSIRKREEVKRKRQEIDATRVQYQCSACSHFCIKLALPLTELPARKTDGSRVVDMAKDLVHLMCAKGGVKLLKREKGTEKQYRYNCELCDLCVGYRSAPYEEETKFLYILPKALTPKIAEEPQQKDTKKINIVPTSLDKGHDRIEN
ncbi:unnamed protein product [Calypogeia fissa]